jgi:outer membrane receptor protein involved in Fe transport
VEDLTSSDITGYSGPGNLYYRGYDDDGSGTIDPGETVRVRVYRAGGEFDIEQTAIYIQDSWDVTDRLNLNFGLRRSTFNNKNAGGETFVKTEDQDALRLGATFDLTGDGSSKVYASYGEYYLPIAANTNIRMSGTELFTQQFCSWDGTLDANEVPGYENCGALGVFGDGSIPDTRSLTDRNLNPMYGDEYILGFSKNFDSGALEGWSLNTYYQRRTLASTIEDVAIDAAVINYYNSTGTWDEDKIDTPENCELFRNGLGGTDCSVEGTFSGFHQYVLTNPGTDMRVYIPEIGENVTLSSEQLRYQEQVRKYDAIT